ncbi:sugar-binding transcriptional regulator [Saccharibacillus kuerlensis]|uniref:sugar-binding transcriptional regulator n=1 Tax=Saccharibacillus kuerlensis TaxID=459527 RepID=UPI000475CF3B|nr:sugar-binding transcriptional regulator [Saccharibacillus kuerlensis]
MDLDRQRLSIEAARLYYLSDYSQQDIAVRLGVSRPTVSRLLQYAKENGFVRISISDPLEDLDALGAELARRFGLQAARVCYSPQNEYREIRQSVAAAAAEYLEETIQDGDIIGITWGTTMHALALSLKHKPVRGVEIVQLKGGVSHSQVPTYAAETANLFAEAFGTIARYLPLPVIFDSFELKRMVEEDRHIQRIIELGRQANVAVFTVGTVEEDALLFKLGYFDDKQRRMLQAAGAGDICSRFFDDQGKICSEEVNARTVGIDLEELRRKEKAILVAGGPRKIRAIRAALTGRYANILVTDQFTAISLLAD